MDNKKKSNTQTNRKKDTGLDIEEWDTAITKKKLQIISKLNIFDYLDSAEDNIKFVKILTNVMQCNIFNVSKCGYLFMKFLENSYIDECIILDALDIYSKEKYELQKQESDEYIVNLRFLVSLIPDLVIKIEMIINLHFLILLNFLNKSKKNVLGENVHRARYRNQKQFIYYSKQNDLINSEIKPSNSILLLMKTVSKISSYFSVYPNQFILNYSSYFKSKRDIVSRYNNILDIFIVDVDNDVDNDVDKDINNNDSEIDIGKTIGKYIIDSCRVLVTEFEPLFDIVFKELHKGRNLSENKKENIKYLKGTFKSFLDMEITTLEKLFGFSELV